MKMTRRHFAQALGGAALGTTMLPGLMGGARAQAGGAPVRFLAIRTPHGADRDFWIPKQSNGGDPASTDQSLQELTFEYEDNSLSPMMPWRDKITVLDGIDTQCVKEGTRGGRRNQHGHNEQGTLLTGAQPPSDRGGNYDNHPSLDFFLHGQLGAPVLLTASVEDSSTWKCMSYDDGGRPRSAEQNPMSLYDQAFPQGFMPPAPGDPVMQPVPMVDYAAGENRIVDYSESTLLRMRARVTGREAAKIDSQLDALSRLQAIEQGGGGGVQVGMCSLQRPTQGGSPGGFDGVINVARAHASVIAQAFACGRARAATLEILNDYPNYFSDLPEVNLGFGQRYHENLVHTYWSGNTGLRAGYTAGLRWSATHVAAVLEELDSMIDPLDPSGGTMLDNTIVFWHSEFGHGPHDAQETRHPCIIAGGGGRTLKLGRYLRVRNIDSNERVPHNKLLTSICHAMGMPDINYFGDRDLAGRAEYQGPLLPLMA